MKNKPADGASLLNDGLDAARNDEMFDWLINKMAEYQMHGLGVVDAKNRAMQDWHTYKATNAKIEGQPD